MPITEVKRSSPGQAFPLATGRLVLRPFVMGDAPSVQHLLGTEDLAKQTLNLPYPFPEGAAEIWIQSTLDDLKAKQGCTLAVERREYEGLMGAVGLIADHKNPGRAELGYWIGRTYWGNGFATEAVQRLVQYGRAQLSLTDIWARAFSENQASIRVLEKAGFRQNFVRDEDCPTRGGLRSISFLDLV